MTLAVVDVAGQAIGPQAWGQFVALGTVIVLLFYVLFHLNKSATDERKRLLESHRDERKEWRDEATIRADKSDAVVEKLTEAIKDLGRGER